MLLPACRSDAACACMCRFHLTPCHMVSMPIAIHMHGRLDALVCSTLLLLVFLKLFPLIR